VLRRIRVVSKAELADRIGRYIESGNTAPLLPNWRYGITPETQVQAAWFESPIRELSTSSRSFQ
jgi:hypothetical protein